MDEYSIGEWQTICEMIVSTLKAFAPVDKRNLIRSIDYDCSDPNNVKVTVSVEYAQNTNKEWIPKVDVMYHKNGKLRTPNNRRNLKSFATGGRNPNEGWFDRALHQVMTQLAQQYEGVVITNAKF